MNFFMVLQMSGLRECSAASFTFVGLNKEFKISIMKHLNLLFIEPFLPCEFDDDSKA